MPNRETLKEWIIEALKYHNGKAKIIDICKYIWLKHEKDLKGAGDLFYTWQYDLRWAGQQLRDDNILVRVTEGRPREWELR